MLHKPARRRSVNLSLDAELLKEAKALGINLSRAAEKGIADAIRRENETAWLAENSDAIEQNNRHFAEHGLPFSEYRGFDG